MADYIRTIPQEVFNMGLYRGEVYSGVSDCMATIKCNSIGCVIGHCLELDDEENIPRIDESIWGKPRIGGDMINFSEWSENFTGLDHMSIAWSWCFSSTWSRIDNTPIGASLRIEYFIKYGVPRNWEAQQFGDYPLVYKSPKNMLWRLRFIWNMMSNYKYANKPQ